MPGEISLDTGTHLLLESQVVVLSTKSCATLVTPRTVTCQAPLAMGCPRQEYWSGLPFPPSGDLPNPGVKPESPDLQADSLPTEPPVLFRENYPRRLPEVRVLLCFCFRC